MLIAYGVPYCLMPAHNGLVQKRRVLHYEGSSFGRSARNIAGENGLVLTLRSAGTGTTAAGVVLADTDGADDAGAIDVGGETPAPTSSNRDTAG